MGETLFRKVWDLHAVRKLPTGQTQLFIGLHLVHEVTSPQAFEMIRRQKGRVPFPDRTVATVDHIVPTDDTARPFRDAMAEEMLAALERNCREFGIPLFPLGDEAQGIVHVIGPELGLTQPGMTIACGDSHTSTHGAFGALAFGIGTSQVRDVLASQTLALEPLKVRRIEVAGALGPGVYAKDVILEVLGRLGVKAGAGFAYEYGGAAVDAMSMEERLTLCNMSIEGGARAGYVNPDRTTFDYLRGRRFSPKGEAFERAERWWASLASDPGAPYDDVVRFDAGAIEPKVTWGINPGQVVGRLGAGPDASRTPRRRARVADRRGARVHGLLGGPSRCAARGRRRLHRLLHERPPLGPSRGGARREGAARGGRGQGARRPRLERRPGRRGKGRARRDLPGGRVRVARRRLLDVPRDEPRPAGGAAGLRVVVEPELQGAAGEPDGPDAPDEPGDGGRGRDRGRGHRRQGAARVTR